MEYVLLTILSLAFYVSGLIIVMRLTPRLLVYSFDQGRFMGIAAVDILGAILAFSAVVITFGIFNGGLGVRVFDFLLLVGILIVAGRVSHTCFRKKVKDDYRTSRIIAGCYGLSLVIAALYYMVQIFTLKVS